MLAIMHMATGRHHRRWHTRSLRAAQAFAPATAASAPDLGLPLSESPTLTAPTGSVIGSVPLNIQEATPPVHHAVLMLAMGSPDEVETHGHGVPDGYHADAAECFVQTGDVGGAHKGFSHAKSGGACS